MKKLLISFVAGYFCIFSFKNVDFSIKNDGVMAQRSALRQFSIDEELILDPEAKKNEDLMNQAVKISENVDFIAPDGQEKHLDDVTSGSGAVIYVNEELDYSLVVTAYHVCETSFEVGDMPIEGFLITGTEKEVISRSGKKFSANIFYKDTKNDLCVMEVSGVAGQEAYVAPFYPPIGAKLDTAGAPLGEWDVGVVNVVSGIYAGIKKQPLNVEGLIFNNFIQWSIPTVGGMSGSGVYYKGRLISVVSAGTGDYANIGYGPNLEALDKVVKQAIEKTREIDRKLELN